MEGEKKGNTAMLTVIAIATLLVAVVGATFAYFSANQSGNGSVQVTATTSKRDVIVVSGTSGELSITTDNELMAQPNANNDTPKYTDTTESDQSGKVTIDITAGTGTAKCEYDLVYKATNSDSVFPGTEVSTGVYATKEFTISGVGKVNGVANNTIAETSLTGCDSTTGCVLNGNTKLVSTGGTSGSTEVWDFTISFYNLTANQDALENRTFGGTVTLENLVCSNDSTSGTQGTPADNTYTRTTQS